MDWPPATRLTYVRSAFEKTLIRAGLRSTRGLTLPRFLGIGAQKAGTSWLHANLRHHPGLFLPETKELHYFDWHYHQPLRTYAAHFADGGERVCGEITPGYSTLSDARVAFVRRVLPEARLILLLRNPIDRAWSHAVMNLVTLPGRRLEEVTFDEFRAHFRDPRSGLRGDYLRTIDTWTRHYPPDRLLIAGFEDIAERPKALLERVFTHLGVSCEIAWDRLPLTEVVFRGAAAPLPDELRETLTDMYRLEIERLIDRLGPIAEGWRG